jgi:nucleoside-diphosphate-sugar epimerase
MVLGAQGYIGSHIARLLADEGAASEVILVERLLPPPSDGPAADRWAELDLVRNSTHELAKTLGQYQPQVVINCVGTTTGDPQHLHQLNVDVVTKLVDALVDGKHPAYLVHIGSAAEYGPPAGREPARETSTAHPAGVYGETKLVATEMVQAAVAAGRISGTVLRVTNPIGAGNPPATLVGNTVRSLRQAIRTDQPAISTGRLDSQRDYIDVRDVARAALAVAYHPHPNRLPPVINIGRGIPVSSRWLVHRLARIAGFKGEIAEQDLGSPRSGAVDWQWADVSVARAALRWTPRYLLAEALDQAWSWFSSTSPDQGCATHTDSTATRPLSPISY